MRRRIHHFFVCKHFSLLSLRCSISAAQVGHWTHQCIMGETETGDHINLSQDLASLPVRANVFFARTAYSAKTKFFIEYDVTVFLVTSISPRRHYHFVRPHRVAVFDVRRMLLSFWQQMLTTEGKREFWKHEHAGIDIFVLECGLKY